MHVMMRRREGGEGEVWKKFEVMQWGMLITGHRTTGKQDVAPYVKGFSGEGMGYKSFENSGSVFNWGHTSTVQ